MFAAAIGHAGTRTNIAKRVKRAVERANEQLAKQDGGEIPPIPVELAPHSLRRTFASLLCLCGENPVYVMQQMGHTDPKLALRIYRRSSGTSAAAGPAQGSWGCSMERGGRRWAPMSSRRPMTPAQVAVR